MSTSGGIVIDAAPGPPAAFVPGASGVGVVVDAAYDAVAYIEAGTVTAIAVDGVATGLTTGTVTVPAGQELSITYSVVPGVVTQRL